MKKEAAKRLINKNLNKSFDKGQFTYFVKNLFNSIEGPTFTYRGNYIPKAYQEYIKTLFRVGKYTGPDESKVDILVVQLEKETSLERARTMQRNFIAWYLNGSRGDVLKDAALVAFVAPNQEDWRLSLVKMAYDLKQTEEGKVKIKKELTPARRWSFLVGTHENTHTVRKQLLPLLVREDEISLSDFEKAFDIEVVTKRFFKKYRELFHRVQEALDKIVETNEKVREEFKKKNVSTIDFAKKLLGQIVFIYFLQRKGWFGVPLGKDWGEGPKDFLRQLFNKEYCEYDNFFDEVLEPLFYESMAKPHDDDYQRWLNCRIPFLNGGLFDPIYDYNWVKTKIPLPNELFSNQGKTEEGDTGTGILDVFDRYNFTVKEDEPLEKEVAVDPEMLGKVFENLLEVKDRKSKGTYYTPREIVHYMCQESLINYLAAELDGKVGKEDIRTLVKLGESAIEHDQTYVQKKAEDSSYDGKYGEAKLPEKIEEYAYLIDQKLADIKICDPAVGSGAFPVGMMNEVVRTRNALSPHLNDGKRTIYGFKQHAIQNSLYGVDIDPGAVEIAKLRLWLSLVVDEEDRHIIQPLPNLDYKIMQGNSLLEEYEGIKLIDKKFFEKQDSKEEKLSSLKERQSKLQREYIELHSQDKLDKVKKVKLEKKLNNLEKQLKNLKKEKEDSNSIKSGDLFSGESKARKKAKKLQRKQREFFRAAHKNEKDKLRKEIENITWDLIEATLKEQDAEDKLEEVEQFKKSNTKPFFLWHLNFSEVFEEKGGFDVVIANPPYVRQEEIKYKNLIKGNYSVYSSTSDLYTYFYEKGFNIAHSNGIMTFISSNKFMRAKYGKHLRQYLKQNTSISEIVNFGKRHVFEAITNTLVFIAKKKELSSHHTFKYKNSISGNKKVICSQTDLKVNAWTIEPEEVMDIKKKIEKLGTPLKDWKVKINYGIKTGYNRAFIIDKKIKDELVRKEPKSIEVIKPILRGRDINRYAYQFREIYLLNIHNGFVNSTGKNIPPIDIDEYPAIKEYLNQFWDKISSRYDQGISPYNLRNCSFLKDFAREKIIWIELTNKNKFSYSSREIYLLAGAFFMIGESLKYLLAFLNSKLCRFYFELICNSSGMATVQWKKFAVERIPARRINQQTEVKIIDIVDKILSITNSEDCFQNSGLQSQVKTYEEQIDRMVYELYELTSEEIEVVERNTKQ